MNLLDLAANYRIILGSASPRRSELLASLGLNFEVLVPKVTEEQQADESPLDYINRNSLMKARAVLALVKDQDQRTPLVISADTIVELDGQVLEKPGSENEARTMLAKLSGRSHQVRTGFCLASTTQGKSDRVLQAYVSTQVEFRKLDAAVIDQYIKTGEPFDKAGGYGIQGQAAAFVRGIQGSYTNVVGLPLVELWEALEAFQTQKGG